MKGRINWAPRVIFSNLQHLYLKAWQSRLVCNGEKICIRLAGTLWQPIVHFFSFSWNSPGNMTQLVAIPTYSHTTSSIHTVLPDVDAMLHHVVCRLQLSLYDKAYQMTMVNDQSGSSQCL